MTKQKSTKRALLTSALALLMCVSMLIGSTFAWFTDSVTSSGNIIKSGTLDVTMEWKDATATGAQQSYKDASKDAIFNYDKWEPGYVEAKNIKIGNAGTLALKYQLNIIATGEVSELADVIDVYYAEGEYTLKDRTMSDLTYIGTLTDVLAAISTTATGDLLANESDTVTLALKMQETAGNKYQGLAIGSEFAVQLLATQLASESDSFDNQYDKDAGYNYGKTNVGPYKLNVLSGGVATYDDATKTYSVAVNTVAQGGWNAAQGNYYAGYTVNVAGYGANATVSFDKPDGTTTVWKLADEERGGFINNGVHQQWTSVGTARAYRYDIDGDGVTDFTVVNDASAAKVEVANAEQLKKVLELGKSAILTADIALTEGVTVPVGADVTLDLNGKNITMESADAVSMITNKGSLTINGTGKIAYTFNGNPNAIKAADTIENYGVLVVNGGEISNTGNGNQIGYAIDNQKGATLTVNDGKITATGSSYYDGIRLMCVSNNETTVTVNGGEISSIWAQNPSANKAKEVKGTVVINGGNVTTTYYENYTTVKVAEGVTATVTPYGAGSNNTTSAVVDGYTVYSFVH